VVALQSTGPWWWTLYDRFHISSPRILAPWPLSIIHVRSASCHVSSCQVISPKSHHAPSPHLQRIHSTPLVTPSKQDILSRIQITLSRDTKFTHTCMRTHHTLVFILRHVTVFPLPIRLVASRIRHVAPDLSVTPPDLPFASRRVQNTFTTSLYQPCHTSDSRGREEGDSLHLKTNPSPITIRPSPGVVAFGRVAINLLTALPNAAERLFSELGRLITTARSRKSFCGHFGRLQSSAA
jgi:hypothetical protein